MSYEGPSIKATRILGDRKPDKQYSVANLELKPGAARPFLDLVTQPDAPCRNDEAFTSDELPSDERAALMCAFCPLATFTKCAEYADKQHESWGVWAGKVRGRKLAEQMKDD